MVRKFFAALLTLLAPSGLMAAPTGMFDSTGMPLVERLIAGSGVDLADINPSSVHYIGAIDGSQAQAGLFDGLVLHGDNDAVLTLGSGIVLSSGYVTNLPATNTAGSYSNETNTGGNNYFRDFPAQTGTSRHGGRLQEKDENSIQFNWDVPANVQGVTLEFVYGSDEFPEWSGTQYADGFVFLVNDVNYATLPDGRPVSLLRQEDNIHFMTNGDAYDPFVRPVADVEYDGLTRVLELTAPVVPGQRNTFTIAVGDTGDQIYDSAVFLSSLRLITGTEPVVGTTTGVKVRHKSEDDLFLEHAEPGDFDRDGMVTGSDLLAWQRGVGTTIAPTDLAAWSNHFGFGATGALAASGAATSSVPEPTTIALLFMAGAAAAGQMRGRRR